MSANRSASNGVVSKTRLSAALSAGWSRVALAMGRGRFADAMDGCEATVKRGIAGPSLPDAEHLLNSLAADPTSLNEVLALYGLVAKPLKASPANDLETVAGLSHLAAAICDALKDGIRCPRDTCNIADIIRPLEQRLNAIVVEADEIRGAA